MIDLIHHDHASQQIGHQPAVFLIRRDQFACQSKNTHFFQRPRLSKTLAAFHAGQRQKRCTAIPVLFQMINQRFAVSSEPVTMFWMLPPSAVSIAVSYFFVVLIKSATTP